MPALRAALKLVVGGTVVLAGVVMIVTPGPAFIVIPAGIALLATEFVWAKRLLTRVRAQVATVANGLAGRKPESDGQYEAEASRSESCALSSRSSEHEAARGNQDLRQRRSAGDNCSSSQFGKALERTSCVDRVD